MASRSRKPGTAVTRAGYVQPTQPPGRLSNAPETTASMPAAGSGALPPGPPPAVPPPTTIPVGNGVCCGPAGEGAAVGTAPGVLPGAAVGKVLVAGAVLNIPGIRGKIDEDGEVVDAQITAQLRGVIDAIVNAMNTGEAVAVRR